MPGPESSLGHGSKPMVPFWDRCTTHFSVDWDVDWRYDLGFDPWPLGQRKRRLSEAGDKKFENYGLDQDMDRRF